jgi:AcrR family transcriptional regulator
MSPRKAAALRNSGDDRTLRDHLIEVTRSMIAQGGAAALTVRAIAREAGVADGVLYNHFADKEELLSVALAAHIAAVESSLPALPAPGEATVAQNLRTHLDYGSALNRAVLPALTGLMVASPARRRCPVEHPRWRDQLAEYLSAERNLGRVADVDPVAAASLISGVCQDLVLSELLGRTTAGADPRFDAVVAILIRGMEA